MTPVERSTESPGGSGPEPDVDQVYGGEPPDALTVAVYNAPARPAGTLVVVICSGGGGSGCGLLYGCDPFLAPDIQAQSAIIITAVRLIDTSKRLTAPPRAASFLQCSFLKRPLASLGNGVAKNPENRLVESAEYEQQGNCPALPFGLAVFRDSLVPYFTSRWGPLPRRHSVHQVELESTPATGPASRQCAKNSGHNQRWLRFMLDGLIPSLERVEVRYNSPLGWNETHRISGQCRLKEESC